MPEPEPSVLDYLKSRLPWSRRRIAIPGPEAQSIVSSPPEKVRGAALPMPWRSVLALSLALLAQVFLEPPNPAAPLSIAFYMLAVALLVWAAVRGEWSLSPHRESAAGNDPLTVRWLPFAISLVLFIPAFISLGGGQLTPNFPIPSVVVSLFGLQDNLFTWLNLALWLATTGLFIRSLWLRQAGGVPVSTRIREFVEKRSWQITVNRWTLLVLAVAAVVVFFRVYHLQQTPAEPFSDHAEKLLDVYDVSQGQTHIFFPRNTGREAIQMYWTLLISRVFQTGLSFLSLKIGTMLIGLFTLPFVYLLGREVANERVGLLATLLAGIGYWPNVISRIGLRFPLAPMFVAPMLLYLIRGLRTRRRNDIILSGIFLGLGLNGYSPFRIVPLLMIVAVVLYALHAQSKGGRQDAVLWLVMAALTSLFIFLPLLRYATANPELFSYRALTRLGSIEQPLPAPWPVVFVSNTWNALRMFNWKDGVIWVHSVPDRPALDIVTAALFMLGSLLLIIRYIRQRHWLDLFILVSVPVLLLPSILSLAFPGENPSLNRTAGAVVPVFLIAAMALDGFIGALTAENRRKLWAYGLTGLLLLWSASQNFDLVFHQFDQNFRNNAWNTSDMGELIKQFRATFGETDTVWIVPFPYWADTRLPGVYAGIPNRDFAVRPEQLSKTVAIDGPKLFMVKADLNDPSQNDQASVDLLKQLYPQGSLSLHRSPILGHDFWVYFVPQASAP